MAINRLIRTVGWLLPPIVSAEAVTVGVLNMSTTRPMPLQALMF